MNREKIKKNLQRIFRDVFKDDSIVIFEEMRLQSVKKWDSLNFIKLIVAVENKFKVSFTIKEAVALKIVGEFISLVQSKIIS